MNNIPKNEKSEITYKDINGNITYKVTSTNSRGTFILYKVEGDKLTKISKSNSPCDFENIVKGKKE